MEPHIIPKVILKEFRIGAGRDSPVLVLDKTTGEYRPRGIKHKTFIGPASYLGDGTPGTLENILARNDEQSIRTIVDLVRSGCDMTQYLPEIKFLLGNNAARNPHFRTHPKVSLKHELSSEEFHTSAMDSFATHYVEYPIHIVRLQSPGHAFILPDFSLINMVLAPDIVIMRIKEAHLAEIAALAMQDEGHFVRGINNKSYSEAQSWVVSNSKALLDSFGGIEHRAKGWQELVG